MPKIMSNKSADFGDNVSMEKNNVRKKNVTI